MILGEKEKGVGSGDGISCVVGRRGDLPNGTRSDTRYTLPRI